MVNSIPGAVPDAQALSGTVSQAVVIGYVAAAAVVAALLLWTLIRRHRQQRLAAQAITRRLRRGASSSHPQEPRVWHDSGLPTQPAAWGYKLGDFGDLVPEAPRSAIASTALSALDDVADSLPEEPGTATPRKAPLLRKARRLKPVRRQAQPGAAPDEPRHWSPMHG